MQGKGCVKEPTRDCPWEGEGSTKATFNFKTNFNSLLNK